MNAEEGEMFNYELVDSLVSHAQTHKRQASRTNTEEGSVGRRIKNVVSNQGFKENANGSELKSAKIYWYWN